jgi:hypothetical protein
MKQGQHDDGKYKCDKAAQHSHSYESYPLSTLPHLLHHPSMTQRSQFGQSQ